MSRVGRKGAHERSCRILEISALEKDRTQRERQLPPRGHGHPARENGFCLCDTPFLIEQRPERKESIRYRRLPPPPLLAEPPRPPRPPPHAGRLTQTDLPAHPGGPAGGPPPRPPGLRRPFFRP